MQPNVSGNVSQFSGLSPCLRFHRVSRDYRRHQQPPLRVISEVNFDVYDHEVCVLLGPSGCGKSTLLRMAAGLDTPSLGAVFMRDELIVGPSRERGMVFQGYTSFPWLTVLQNIEYRLRINGDSISLAEGAAERFLERVNLQGFRNAYPDQLSGGMRQRVALARALANYPRVLLMDEPFGALDAETRWQMQELLLDIVHREKMTVLLVTHDIDEALFLGDRIVFLSRHPGRVKEVLTPDFKRDERFMTKESLYEQEGYHALEKHIMRLMREEGISRC